MDKEWLLFFDHTPDLIKSLDMVELFEISAEDFLDITDLWFYHQYRKLWITTVDLLISYLDKIIGYYDMLQEYYLILIEYNIIQCDNINHNLFDIDELLISNIFHIEIEEEEWTIIENNDLIPNNSNSCNVM